MVIIEIVPGEAGGAAGAKVGQNAASVTGGAGEGTPALAGSAGGMTFCREMRHRGNPWSQIPFQSGTAGATDKSSSPQRVNWSALLPLDWQDPPPVSLPGGSRLLRYNPQEKEDHGAPPAPASRTYFYKLLSPRSSQKGNQGHSGPPAAGSGHPGTAGSCSRYRGGQPHSGSTEGGSLRGQGGTERRHRCCECSVSFLHWRVKGIAMTTAAAQTAGEQPEGSVDISEGEAWDLYKRHVFEVFSKWPGPAEQLSLHPLPIEQPSNPRAACDRYLPGV